MWKFLLVLTLLVSPVFASEQDRIGQLVVIAQEKDAPDGLLTDAIAEGLTPQEFLELFDEGLRIVAVAEAPKGMPVQIRLESLPKNSAKTWRRSPIHENDWWLQLYDETGSPVIIFWSEVGGLKNFELITSVNGTVVPLIETAKHTLAYGDVAPPVPPPGPVPSIEIPDHPNTVLQELVQGLLAAGGRIEPADLITLTEFYLDFSDVVRRDDGDIIENTSIFRDVYMDAGELMYEETGMTGKYAGLAEIVDGIMSDYLGLDVGPLDASRTADVLNAIAWAFYKGLAQ